MSRMREKIPGVDPRLLVRDAAKLMPEPSRRLFMRGAASVGALAFLTGCDIVDGDTAAMRWAWKAVHTGTSPSLGIPATGKRIHMMGCSVYRFRDGKVVEQWEYSDLLGLLQQLGVIPALG